MGAGIFWVMLSTAQLGQLDAGLNAQERVLLAGISDDLAPVFRGGKPFPDETPQGVAMPAVLFDLGGHASLTSPSAPVTSLAAILAGQRDRDTTSLTAWLDGSHQRILIRRAVIDGRDIGWLIAMRPLDEYDAQQTLTALFLALTVVVMETAASVAGYWLSGRVLRPVRRISAMARDISSSDLHRRIQIDTPDDELGELVSTFNDMLARLETTFATMRHFTADAAHEFRSPLAQLRTTAEVALRGSRTVGECKEALQSVLATTEHLTRLTDHLLLLARDDADSLALGVHPVDLVDLIQEAAVRWEEEASRRAAVIVLRLPASARVEGDEVLLRRVVDNLVDNALRHGGRGVTVTVSAAVMPDRWELSVEDDGPGIAPAMRSAIFERFRRGARVRPVTDGGAGLGLAICRVIVRRHGGDVALEDTHPHGARFRISVPRRLAARGVVAAPREGELQAGHHR